MITRETHTQTLNKINLTLVTRCDTLQGLIKYPINYSFLWLGVYMVIITIY